MPRWLKISLLLLALPALALATLPWWLGLAAGPVLRRWNVTLQNYETVGYTRFRVEEVRFARGNVTVVVRDLAGTTPLLWWRPAARTVSAGTWSVDVKPSPSPDPTPATGGLPALHARLGKISTHLRTWLPRAEVGSGAVHWPGGELTLAKAAWNAGVLAAEGVRFLQQEFALRLDTAQPGLFAVQAAQVAAGAEVNLQWREETVDGSGTLWGQPLQLESRFSRTSWLPLAAKVRAENWVLPAERARLGAQYSRLAGGGTLTWEDRSFTFSLQARAEPKEGVKAPPFEARVEAQGDPQALTITALQVDAPFARATLSGPVVVGFNGQARGEPARLTVEADLAKQPWFEATGQVRGSVNATDATHQEFSLTVEAATLFGISVPRAAARGSWQWPRLALTQLEVQLDESSRASATGAIDWERQRLEKVTFEATGGAAWFARWLPAGLTWKSGALRGTLDGPFAAPQHAGELSLAQAQAGPLKPFDLAATWHGEGAAPGDFSADLTAEKSQLHLAGRGETHGLVLHELSFSPDGKEVLALAAPLPVSWSPVWRINGAKLQGPTATVTVEATGGPAGSVQLLAANLDKEWVHDWLDIRGPTWRVRQLQADGRVVDGLLHFTTELTGEIHLPGRDVAEVALSVSGDGEGLRLTGLKISEAGQVLTQATGRLPVTWRVEGTPHLRVAEGSALELQADVQPASPLWAALAEPAHITLTGASAQAEIKGTLKEPLGDLRVNIASLKVAEDSRWRNQVPDVAGFALVAQADRAQVRIESLAASVEGQALTATARLPMDDGRWRALLSTPASFDWHEAEGSLEIPGADLMPLARRLPRLPMASGRLQARVELARGGALRGSLQLTGAATRPLPALGVIQEITTSLSFSGRAAKIETFTARLGGEPVDLSGTIDFPAGEAPQPQLKLSGKNLPLVRRAGLLVRSDLDLRTESPRGGGTRLTGVVNLRDCLVLSDLSSLLPTGLRGVRRQPPYFSVEAEPFSEWPLAVELRGPSAIRLRTPFFTGTASAHFTLSGTLGEPRAIGEVTVEEGKMFFPFATFTVQNGAIRLRAADPFTPELTVNAISRRRSYELRLEATGSLEAPALVFSSNPPLEAGEVLLMVMAGQMPADETAGTSASGGLRLTQLGAYLGQGIYRGLGGTGENRLEIASGEQISRLGRETYEIEYKLGERWSLVGEYDEFDSYNGGVKWRIYTQEGQDDKK